jgi:hypothetical protein
LRSSRQCPEHLLRARFSLGSILWFDPRRGRSSVPTATLAAVASRACQVWPRLRGPPVGLGLDWPEHGGMLDRFGLQAAGICTVVRDWPLARIHTGCRWTMAGSGFFLFAGPPAQTVALEFDAMSVVDDAVQYRVANRLRGGPRARYVEWRLHPAAGVLQGSFASDRPSLERSSSTTTGSTASSAPPSSSPYGAVGRRTASPFPGKVVPAATAPAAPVVDRNGDRRRHSSPRSITHSCISLP